MKPAPCKAAVATNRGLIRCFNLAVDGRFCKHHAQKFAFQAITAGIRK